MKLARNAGYYLPATLIWRKLPPIGFLQASMVLALASLSIAGCTFATDRPLYQKSPIPELPGEQSTVFVYRDDPTPESWIRRIGQSPVYFLVEPKGSADALERSPFRRSKVAIDSEEAYKFIAPPGQLTITILGFDGMIYFRAMSLSFEVAAHQTYYVRVIKGRNAPLPYSNWDRFNEGSIVPGSLVLTSPTEGDKQLKGLKTAGGAECGLESDKRTILCFPSRRNTTWTPVTSAQAQQ